MYCQAERKSAWHCPRILVRKKSDPVSIASFRTRDRVWRPILPRERKDSPPDGPQCPRLAGGGQKIPLEPDEEVVRQNADPEEHRVGVKIPGGQIPHPHFVLEALEEVLELSPQLVP